MLNKLSILLYVYRSKVNGKGLVPVYCRITLNGRRKQFSTGCSLQPMDWDAGKSKYKGLSSEARHINKKLSSIRKAILKAYDDLALKSKHFDVDQLYDEYCGRTIEVKTILGVFDLHILQIKELLGKDYSPATYQKFILIKSHIKEFIKTSYRLDDYPLADLKLGFLYDLEHYLKARKKQNQNTVNKTIERVKKISRLAVAHGWLSHDPFALFRKKPYTKEVVFLDNEELRQLESCQLSERLNTVRLLFLFSCYTGLAYHELTTLRKVHIKKDNKGMLWIEMIRQKTKRPISVLLLPKALDILESYDYTSNAGILLPVISNQKLNAFLKEIAVKASIHKHLTHHVARKTFATTVLLNNDVPVDVASFMLGHSRVSTTEEFYAKVQKERVVTHLQKLNFD
ncbi:site-specific integrase [Mucilaginibacter aquatilis]|uniref:Tyrosine-type recombinase/integrase n=1 Tax=Mucilaginibacter aquatilis TaxID=1517760 RepID=A0A6I4IBS5_9SPHI|nr:site-specific integrase [Mucilaginibacter aquatilis]MVN92675.1 tyrosine-type recombinase/integrase [Mucilaginibacter aquatilis]